MSRVVGSGTIYGLDPFGVTDKGLRRLGRKRVEFYAQFRASSRSLFALPPIERGLRLRDILDSHYARLIAAFPDAELRRRAGCDRWTVEGVIGAERLQDLAKRKEIECVWVSSIEGLRARRRRAKAKGWFCVWGIVAVQIEDFEKGLVTVEDRLVLVKAFDEKDAERKLRKEWRSYAEPYMNHEGRLVRWKLIRIQDVYDLICDEIDPNGTEVYSRLRDERMKEGYVWRRRTNGPASKGPKAIKETTSNKSSRADALRPILVPRSFGP
jgi:hypothetical protein